MIIYKSLSYFLVSLLISCMMPVYAGTIIFSDDFNRPDSTSVGNGWTEIEGSGGVGISSSRLNFTDTSNEANRPIVYNTFTGLNSGIVSWSFEFDWSRIGSDNSYSMFMQLGDSSLMRETESLNGLLDDGVGINLSWTGLSGTQESLEYVQNGLYTPISQISGNTTIQVLADMDTYLYSVLINGSVVVTDIGFDNNVSSIDSVRFYTDEVDTNSFSGRNFDNVQIEAVPVPAAVWLFSSGLIGLIGMARRKKA